MHRDKPVAVLATVDRFLAQSLVPRIVVVDNGSAPAALDRVRAGLTPGVALVEAGANTGFGPGANIGFRWLLARAPAPWLAVCPHDANPLPGCLERLVEVAAAQPRAGLASADVGDGLTPILDRYFGAIPAPATVVDGWEPSGYPHGTLMLARRECLAEVGLFDERYFAYCEEAELALRAKRRLAGGRGAGGRGPQHRRGLAGRGGRLPAAAQHAADGARALGPLPRPSASRSPSATWSSGPWSRAARALLGAGPAAGHRPPPAPLRAAARRPVPPAAGGPRPRSPASAAATSGRTRTR